jgi:hypothetical protein
MEATGACTNHARLLEPSLRPIPAQNDPFSGFIYRVSKIPGLHKTDRLARSMSLLRSVPKIAFSSEKTAEAQRGYRVFEPGDYVYDFELPLDSQLPESIEVELGWVKYELKAIVERAGAFRDDLVGSREVTLIRTPAEDSMEQFHPIAINRGWEDELHIEFIVCGKSFPLDAQIPISCTLTTQVTVQFHWMKVFATEHIEYLCSDKRVRRMEPVRETLLFEKRGDILPTSTFFGSLKRAVSGGARAFDQSPAGLKTQAIEPTAILGDLGGDASNLVTEMEVLAQLPSCPNMTDLKSPRFHSDTTYQNIRIHHWIKVDRPFIVGFSG